MTGPVFLSDHVETPASATLRPLEDAGVWHGARADRIELVSRGDIVNGVLARSVTPTASRRHRLPALLLLAHDAGASSASTDFGPVASWVADGLTVAAIDLPLHGHRTSPKLSERLIESTLAIERGDRLDRNSQVLVDEFLRQATSDLMRTLDAVLQLDEVDAKRVGFLGLGLGARLGSSLVQQDDRIGAAVLARAPGDKRQTPPPFPNADPVSNGTPSGERAAVLTIHFDRRTSDWPAAARPFLASRLGF